MSISDDSGDTIKPSMPVISINLLVAFLRDSTLSAFAKITESLSGNVKGGKVFLSIFFCFFK